MRQTLFLVLLSLVSVRLLAQETKRITSSDKDSSCKEIYYVLKDDPSIKHGPYKRTTMGNVSILGQYEQGRKAGMWEYYDPGGELVHKYDYSEDKLVYNKSTQPEGDSDYLRKPVPLGGYATFYQAVSMLLEYPPVARRKGTQGKVYIKCYIGRDGKMGGARVVDGITDGCAEETLRVINLIDIEWLPALNKEGKPVNVEMTIPITFKLG